MADDLVDLSIYRLRRRGEKIEDVLAKGGLARFPLELAGAEEATLHIKRPSAKPPKWAKFFSGYVELNEFGKGASVAAVLLVVAGEEWFAVPFGIAGASLIQDDAIEDRFGLLTVLNSIPRDRVRSIDKTTLDSRTQSLVQAARETSPQEFGLDVERDLVRAVTGSPDETMLGRRLSGKDGLRATLAVSLNVLPQRLLEYSQRSKAKHYKKHFAWIDHISPVSDEQLSSQLDAKAVEFINLGDDAKCWAAVPEVIDWGSYVRFRYGGYKSKNALHHDVTLTSWIGELNESIDGGFDQADVDVGVLRSTSVRCVDEGGEEVDRWSMYQCLSAEVDFKHHSYVLANGKWYRVDKDFVQDVDAFCRAIEVYGTTFPDYDDESETHYNSRICSESNGEWALMDRKNITFGSQTPVEFCDVYTTDGDIVHIKRYSQSSVLSHLFAQGTVSGELFRAQAGFRQLVNEKLPTTHRLPMPSVMPGQEDHRIVFGVISGEAGDNLTLPFFSRLNLRAATTRLRAYGYRVALAKIAINKERQLTKKYLKSK